MDRRTGSPAEAETWLPNGAARRPAKPRPATSRSAPRPEDWLPATAARRSRGQALVTLPGLGPAEGDGEPNGELAPGYAAETAPGRDPLSALEKQLARLENVIAGQTERIERQQDLITRLGVAGPDPSVEVQPQPRWPEIGSFDPNSVSAGELRRIGLSKTQAARFLARQRQPGGFSSVEDFDELRGFPAALRDKLKAAARISA